MNTSIGERIALMLDRNKITQRELAEAIDVADSTLYRYIKNEVIPSAVVLGKIATALHTTTDYLLGNDIGTDEASIFNTVQDLINQHGMRWTKEQKLTLIDALFGA